MSIHSVTVDTLHIPHRWYDSLFIIDLYQYDASYRLIATYLACPDLALE